MAIDQMPPSRRDLLGMMSTTGAGLLLTQAAPAAAQTAQPQAKAVAIPLRIEIPTAATAAPYGDLLGKPFPSDPNAPASFRTTSGMAVWRQHMFDPGAGGEVEIVWVNHKGDNPVIDRLEQHDLTEQAIVPLTGDIIHIVGLSGPDGLPDLASLRAFRLPPGLGICMARKVWHTSRSRGITNMMITRGSTSLAMSRFQRKEGPIAETRFVAIAPVRLVDPI